MITINIKEDVWEYLNKQKKPGETFNEVLSRLIQKVRSQENLATPGPASYSK